MSDMENIKFLKKLIEKEQENLLPSQYNKLADYLQQLFHKANGFVLQSGYYCLKCGAVSEKADIDESVIDEGQDIETAKNYCVECGADVIAFNDEDELNHLIESQKENQTGFFCPECGPISGDGDHLIYVEDILTCPDCMSIIHCYLNQEGLKELMNRYPVAVQ